MQEELYVTSVWTGIDCVVHLRYMRNSSLSKDRSKQCSQMRLRKQFCPQHIELVINEKYVHKKKVPVCRSTFQTS